MLARMLGYLVAVGTCLVAARWVAAQAVTMGSPLTAPPNISVDCATQPAIADSSGIFGLFPSGVADCTWRQAGVFGVLSGDPRFSSVPGDGRITSVSVLSGPNPAPIRLVILRQLSTPGFGAESQCCFFVSETAPVQPQPNAITTFATDLPVVRNTIRGFFAVDLIGISAASGTGSLPLHSTGRNNAFDLTQPGSVNAGFFYPRLGVIPNDTGGGRREDTIPGVEVLMQWTWCPTGGVGPGCGAAGGPAGGGGGGTTAGPALRNQAAQVANGRALIDLVCNGNAVCRGLLELLSAGTARAATPKVARYGKLKYEIPAGGTTILKVKLKGKAKRLVKKNGSVQAELRLTPEGGAAVTSGVTLTR